MSVSCPTCAREYPDDVFTCPDDGAALTTSPEWNESTRISGARKVVLPPEPDDTLTGTTVGEYQVGDRLGAGAMGEVYAAVHAVIGKKVAIKVLRHEVAADQANVKRMLAEGRAVNAIAHQSIVGVFNYSTLPDGRPYLVMEYLDGQGLDRFVAERGALPPAIACRVLEDIAAGLQAAHQAGVIHRDLKPANVFLVKDESRPPGFVKLLDFGLAKTNRVGTSGPITQVTQTGMVVGTPDYIAPEQARGHTVDGRTDLYSLGVMAFELLTGQLPYRAASVVELVMQHLTAPVPRPSSLVPHLPPALDDLVVSMLAKEPGDRPASAEAVRKELKRIRDEVRTVPTELEMPAVKPPRAVPAKHSGPHPARPPPASARATEATSILAKAPERPKPAPQASTTLVDDDPVEPRPAATTKAPALQVEPAPEVEEKVPGRSLGPAVAVLGVLLVVSVVGVVYLVTSGSGSGGDPTPPTDDPTVTKPADPGPVDPTPKPSDPAPKPADPTPTPDPVAKTADPAVKPPPDATPEKNGTPTPTPKPPDEPIVPKPTPKVAGPKPKPLPKVQPTPKAVAAPTRPELRESLARAARRVRETPVSPQLIDRLVKNLEGEIDGAETPEQRAQAARDVKDFEKRYTQAAGSN